MRKISKVVQRIKKFIKISFFLSLLAAGKIFGMEDPACFKSIIQMKQELPSEYKSLFVKSAACILGALCCFGVSHRLDIDTSYKQSKNMYPNLCACGGIILLGIGCCHCLRACNEYHELKRLERLLKDQ